MPHIDQIILLRNLPSGLAPTLLLLPCSTVQYIYLPNETEPIPQFLSWNNARRNAQLQLGLLGYVA
jgi:hypothetical protein